MPAAEHEIELGDAGGPARQLDSSRCPASATGADRRPTDRPADRPARPPSRRARPAPRRRRSMPRIPRSAPPTWDGRARTRCSDRPTAPVAILRPASSRSDRLSNRVMDFCEVQVDVCRWGRCGAWPRSARPRPRAPALGVLAVVHLGPVDEDDDVGVLLDGAGIAQVARGSACGRRPAAPRRATAATAR